MMGKPRRISALVALLVGGLLAGGGVMAGGGLFNGRTVPFDTLAAGASFTAGLERPAIFVAGGPTDLARLGELGDNPAVAAAMAAAEPDSTWVVAVFSGMMGSAGHGVTVRDIRVAGNEVRVTVELTRPAPGMMAADVITYPYHAIRVARERVEVPAGATWTVVTADGTLLAHTTTE